MKGCGIAWNDMVHGCMVYTEHTKMAAVPYGTSHASAASTPPVDIQKHVIKSYSLM